VYSIPLPCDAGNQGVEAVIGWTSVGGKAETILGNKDELFCGCRYLFCGRLLGDCGSCPIISFNFQVLVYNIYLLWSL